MNARELIAAGLLLVPGLLFTEIARQQWLFWHARRPHSRAFRLLPVVSTAFAVHYLLLTMRALVPGGRPPDAAAMVRTPWHILSEDPWLIALALLRHLLYLLPLPERRPRVAWLAGNYGLALGAMVASAFLRLRPGATPDDQELAHRIFELAFSVLGVLCAVQFVRNARPGGWRPEYAGEMRRPDVVLVRSFAIAAVLSMPVLYLVAGVDFAVLGFEVLLGLGIAAPMASRMLGYVVPGVVTAAGLVVTGAGIFAAYTCLLRQAERHRARPRDRQADGRGPRRSDRRDATAGRGAHVHGGVAPSDRAGVTAGECTAPDAPTGQAPAAPVADRVSTAASTTAPSR